MEPITDPTICCQVHNYWQNKFIAEDLRPEQRRKKTNEKTSAFAAMLKKTYGSRRFVMAIFQSGMSWRARAGANNVARLMKWILEVTKAITEHRNDPLVKEQRRKSDSKKGANGLTDAEKAYQQARAQAS